MAETAKPEPAAVPPIKLGGVGLNVADLGRSEAFYSEVVGLKVAVRVPAGGPAKEIAFNISGSLADGGPFVVLAHFGEPPSPGRTGFGRVIVNTTDAEAVARRARAAGFAAITMSQPGLEARPVYFLTDPDGYQVELYQASTAEMNY